MPRIMILSTVVLLVPILLGLTPMNFVQKMGTGCPLDLGKKIQRCNPCPFHSMVSHEDHELVKLPQIISHATWNPLGRLRILHSDALLSTNPPRMDPLRC